MPPEMPAVDLTKNERTVLGLASAGMAVASIARWEDAFGRLVSKGLLHRLDEFNHTITAAGREFVVALDAAEDAALLRAMLWREIREVARGRARDAAVAEKDPCP